MPFHARRCSAVVAWSLAFAATPIAAYAQASYSFNLPAQPLADSLRAIGRHAHVNIAFDPAIVSARNARALKGDYFARQALETILAGTGLAVRMTPGGSYWVERSSVQRDANSSVGEN